MNIEGIEERTKDGRHSRRHKMAIDDAFKFWKIVVIWEVSKWDEVPQVGSARKETVRVEVVAVFRCFNRKWDLDGILVAHVNSFIRGTREKMFIRAMKIFGETTEGSQILPVYFDLSWGINLKRICIIN